MLNLAVRVKPYADESFVGYMGRLANANALPHAYFQSQFFLLSENDQVEFLSKVNAPGGWTETVVELRSPRSNRDPIYYRTPKHCPQCLLDNGYWKQSWMYKLYNVCAVHGVRLVDRCPHCKVVHNFSAFSQKNCDHCGNDYLVQEALEKAGTIEIWFANLVENRIWNSKPINSSIVCNLPIQDFHDALFSLGQVVSTEFNGKRLVGVVRFTDDVRLISQASGTIVFDWPWSFYEYLNSIYSKRGGHWTATACFHRVRHVLYHRLKDPRFDFLRAEFEHYLAENWKGPIDSKSRSLSSETIEKHLWKPVATVAKMLGLKVSRVESFMRQGRIASTSIRYDCGKVSTILNLKDVQKIATEQAAAQTLTEVSRRLGIGERRVRELIKSELLPVLTAKGQSQNSWWLDCDSFLDKIRVSTQDIPEGRLLNIRSVFKNWLKGERGAEEFTRLIIDGTISVYAICGPSRFSDLVLSECDLKRALVSKKIYPPLKGFCTYKEAAALLNIPGKYVRCLIRSELIAACSTTLQYPRISMKELNDFHQEFISTNELSRVCGTRVFDLMNALASHGFVPALNVQCVSGHSHEFWLRGPALDVFISSNYGRHRCAMPRYAADF